MAKYFVLLGLVAVLAAVDAQRDDRTEIAKGTFDLASRHNAARTPGNRAPIFAGHRRPPVTFTGHHRGHGHGHRRGGHRGRGGRGSQTGRSGLYGMHRAVRPAIGFNPANRAQGETSPGSHHKRLMDTIRAHLGAMRNNGFQGHSTRGQGQGPHLRFASQVGRRGGHHGNGRFGNHMHHGHNEGSDDMRPEMRVAHHMGRGNKRMGHGRGHGMGPRYTVA